MRIPYKKIYRAFPELDQFTDQQCEAFVARARLSRDFQIYSQWWIVAAVAGSLMVLATLQCAVGGVVFKFLRHRMSEYTNNQVFAILCALMWLGVPAIAGLMARDRFLWRQLGHAIWRRIERIRCAQCKYSLLGQRLHSNQIICPECGETTTLAALGLAVEEDLLPPPELCSPVQ